MSACNKKRDVSSLTFYGPTLLHVTEKLVELNGGIYGDDTGASDELTAVIATAFAISGPAVAPLIVAAQPAKVT